MASRHASDWPSFPINDTGDTTEYCSSESSSDSDSDFVKSSDVRTDPILLNLMRERKQKRRNPEQHAAEKLKKDKKRVQYLEGKIMRTRNKMETEYKSLNDIGQKLEKKKNELQEKRQQLEKQEQEHELWLIDESQELVKVQDKLDERFAFTVAAKQEYDQRYEKFTNSVDFSATQIDQLGKMTNALANGAFSWQKFH